MNDSETEFPARKFDEGIVGGRRYWRASEQPVRDVSPTDPEVLNVEVAAFPKS